MTRVLWATLMFVALVRVSAAQVNQPAPGDVSDEPRSTGAIHVPLDSWVYPAFDKLAALGYLPTGIMGQRPWTRAECGRLVEEVAEQFYREGIANDMARNLYQRLATEFENEYEAVDSAKPKAAIDSIYVRAAAIGGTPLSDGYHFGQTVINDFGRNTREGFNAIAGVSLTARAGRYFVALRSEYQHAPEAPGYPDAVRAQVAAYDGVPVQAAAGVEAVNRLKVIDGYAGVAVGGWMATIGKQSLWWGPTSMGPMIFSNNAEPIYMLRLQRHLPFEMPGIFRWMGPVRTEFFIGRLQGHRFIDGLPLGPSDSQPFIHGQKLSFKPTSNLEFGFSRTTIFAGGDIPLTTRVVARSIFSTGNSVGATDPGDRRSGFDVSYRVPMLRDWLTVYLDSFTEDEFSPIAYPRRSAFSPGLYLVRLPRLPKVDFRLEGVYTNLPGLGGAGVYYFNARYRNGYTNRGNIIGSWIGREGYGYLGTVSYALSTDSRISMTYRAATVDKTFLGGGQQRNVSARADVAVAPAVRLGAFLQYERWNFPLLRTSNTSDVTGWIQVSYQPFFHGGK